ncbi:MAG: DUF3786 domain-containing protein [Actinomycetota bacterium]|nr:DUF3786 domain-containing protein [Actinomycetota bacterium]
MDNYDLVLNQLIERLARFNYAIVASRTGAEFDLDNDALKLRFLGEDYIVTKKDCKCLGSNDSSKDHVLVVDYLLSFGGLDSGDGWIDFRDLPNSLPYDGAFRANVESVLERNVSNIIARKNELIKKLDGYRVPLFSCSDFAVAFQVFPRVECLVILCEGDDEIGPGAKLLFSSKAPQFLSTESLAAIAEALTRRLVE